MSSLTLRYEFSRDDDDFGWLTARLQTPAFSGRNGMWVQWQNLVQFGDALARYPIEAARPVAEEWGLGGEADYKVITRIAIAPEGNTGGLLCVVSLADYYEPQNCCRSAFETDYPAVKRFRQELAAMMRKEAEQAVLSGAD